MAWNCDFTAAQIAAWQTRYRVRMHSEAWQEWLLAVAVPPAESDTGAAIAVESALRGYFGTEVPLVGRTGGDRGEISDLEVTVHPDGWTYQTPPSSQPVTEIAASDRPTLLLGEGEGRARLAWAVAKFVYRGGAKDLPWFAWDFAPSGAAVVGGLGWAPECPLRADIVLTSAAPLTARAVPAPDDSDPTGLGGKLDKAAANIADAASTAVFWVGGLALGWLILTSGRGRR